MSELPDRFWTQVDKTDDCWLWTGSRNNSGYGRMTVAGRGGSRLVHRLAYEDACGPIPDGLVLDHLCSVPQCVRPSHLEPVTQRENLRRSSRWLRYLEQGHCPEGHPLTTENTYRPPKRPTYPECRTCRNERSRRYHASRKAAA